MGSTTTRASELGAWRAPDTTRRAGRASRAAPRGPLVPDRAPIRATEELPAGRRARACAGRLRRRPRPEHGRLGPAAASARPARARRCTLRFAEMLDAGRHALHREPARRPAARTATRSRGDGDEVYEPRFTFHGFRYVEVTRPRPSAPARASPGGVVHSDTPRTRHVRVLRRRSSTSCSATSTGASAATSSPSRPTARSATSASAGRATSQVFAADRALQHGRRGVLRQVAATTSLDAQRADGALPGRRAARACSSATARPRGRTPASSCRGRCGSATATAACSSEHFDAMARCIDVPAAPQPGPPVDAAPQQRLRRLAVASAPTRRRTCIAHGLLRATTPR